MINLTRARTAILGNPDHLAMFRADPTHYLARLGLAGDALDPELLELAQADGAPVAKADPDGSSRAHGDLVVRPSAIHGDGVFTAKPLPAGSVLCDMVVGDDVSRTASKVNQSKRPNAAPAMNGGSYVLRTVESVPAGSEVVADYPLPNNK